jgi:iron complex transport system ATP-binding protein
MVTHHVEEIPSGFTHALLLKEGAVTAAGPIDEVINAANLSLTFGLVLDVAKSNGRFTARAA